MRGDDRWHSVLQGYRDACGSLNPFAKRLGETHIRNLSLVPRMRIRLIDEIRKQTEFQEKYFTLVIIR